MATNEILYSEDDEQRGAASLTKMMTLYVLFGYLRAGKVTPETELVVTRTPRAKRRPNWASSPARRSRVSDATRALVTQSANDAAATVAENLAGTEENFARLMTEKARSIGMNDTLFRNASGLPNDEQVTTAHDMALLAQHLIRDYPEYYTVFETKYFAYKGKRYRNHNHLLFGYKGTDGIKTGYTRASGFNLAASAHRGNKHLLAVVLGGRTGSQRDAATRALLDKHFAKASETKPTPTSSAWHRSSERRLRRCRPIKKPDLTLASMAPAPRPPLRPPKATAIPPQRQRPLPLLSAQARSCRPNQP